MFSDADRTPTTLFAVLVAAQHPNAPLQPSDRLRVPAGRATTSKTVATARLPLNHFSIARENSETPGPSNLHALAGVLYGADDPVRTGDLNLGKTPTTVRAARNRAIPYGSVRQKRPCPWSRWDAGWDAEGRSTGTVGHSQIERGGTTRRGDTNPKYIYPMDRLERRRIRRNTWSTAHDEVSGTHRRRRCRATSAQGDPGPSWLLSWPVELISRRQRSRGRRARDRARGARDDPSPTAAWRGRRGSGRGLPQR